MQSVEFTYAPEKIDDRRLFMRLRRAYRARMLKWWMRYHLSFKTLKVIIPVQVSSIVARRACECVDLLSSWLNGKHPGH